jgi:uncharacterized protein (TIGR02246 family)
MVESGCRRQDFVSRNRQSRLGEIREVISKRAQGNGKSNMWWRAVAAALFCLLPAMAFAQPSAETAIRDALSQWTAAFNAGRTEEVCGLFAPDLRYDYRGFPERGYDDICGQLKRSLTDASRKYAYALDLKEVIVSGDLAVVRLMWRLRVTPAGGAKPVDSVEAGTDIFRKQPNGRWQIVRFIAYEE